MPRDEHYFGFGDKVGPLDRRGQSFTLWNTDSYNFQESTDPLYKSIPFFLTLREGCALGVLLDNTWRSSFDFGKETSNVYPFGAEDGPIDYYLLYGPDAKHVLTAYAWLLGLLHSLRFGRSDTNSRAIATEPSPNFVRLQPGYVPIAFQPMLFTWTLIIRRTIGRSPWIQRSSPISHRCYRI